MSSLQRRIIWLLLSAAVIVFLYLIVCLVIYRTPAGGEPQIFSGRVIYKLNDIAGTNRQFFEEQVMGNRIVRLDDDSVWYVPEDDYNTFWPEDPYEMRQQGYTIRIELKADKLLFDGYIMREIRERDLLQEAPTIID